MSNKSRTVTNTRKQQRRIKATGCVKSGVVFTISTI